MADRIAVMREGRVVQVGSGHDIYDRPASTFVAQLVGTPRINLLPAERQNGHIHVANSPITLSAERMSGGISGSFTLGVRPEDVQPRPEGAFAGQVALAEPLGAETVLHIRSGEQMVTSMVPGLALYGVGDALRFDIAHERLHVFDAAGARVG
jgi:ABC-type sugar transport system ATPase subunit